MVERPDQDALGRTKPDRGQPHQRRRRQVEPSKPVRFEIPIESSCTLPRLGFVPVFNTYGKRRRGVHDLRGFVEPFPVERRAQDRVTVDGARERGFERGHVEGAVDLEHELIEILSRSLAVEVVEQQSFLERRQEICGFDIVHGGHGYRLPLSPGARETETIYTILARPGTVGAKVMSPDSKRTPWIAFRRTTPSAMVRLFCLPYAGAGASVFRPWSELLAPEIELCAIQLRGREDRSREERFTRMEPLVEALAGQLGGE